ncbi:hypothetical protein ABEV74_11510 [Paenibacillus cisolokensis]|uniref:hypothetical protein n=1 Tax=Paenibacillus cisolokensis TaxID=1658519 RepID=UPI003D279D44
MKFKKHIMIASVVIAGALTFGVLSTSAIDPFTSTTDDIKKELEENKGIEKKALVMVGETPITTIDLANYKSYKKVDNVKSSDEELLKELVIEELFLQLAKEKNVYATFEQGMAEAKKNRQILESQSQQVQDVQQKFIELTGLTEEQYWTDLAPKEYQKLISMQNLVKKLVEVGELKQSEDPNEFGKELREYKEKLFKAQLNKKVKVLDSSFTF